MDTIIITVDLGHFRAFSVTETPRGRAKVDLIESYDSIEGHGKLGQKVSDAAGRFVGGGGEGEVAKGYGEPHNLQIEMQKKLARMIARDINGLIEKQNYTAWCLAAPEKINSTIVKHLKAEVKRSLIKKITADLTNLPKSEVPDHFK